MGHEATLQQRQAAQDKGRQLMKAFHQKNDDVISQMLEHIDFDLMVTDESGLTALHHVARRCNPKWVEALVEVAPRGAPTLVDAQTFFGRSPSLWSALNCVADASSCSMSDKKETVTYLAKVSKVDTLARLTDENKSVDKVIQF